MMLIRFFSCFCWLCLAACTTSEAPIVDGWTQAGSETSDYRVQAGDTIYSIAWAFGMDYRDITQLNQLKEPYHLQPGQALRMSKSTAFSRQIAHANTVGSPAMAIATPPVSPPAPMRTPLELAKPSRLKLPAANPLPATATSSKSIWLWPTSGKVIHGFSAASGGNKGIDITGKLDQDVIATASGKVVYTGASLPGYGNLIIIKHNDNQLSAYAFNKVLAVKEGQVVKAGQMIAKMGKDDMGKALLHFEIREAGKPVDPMPYLQHTLTKT